MFLVLLVFCSQLTELFAVIPFDGIIHRSSDGSSYAFLTPPKNASHAAFIEEMTPSGTLAVAWFTGAEGQSNTSIAVSLLATDSAQFTAGLIVSEHVNYSNQNPVLFWNDKTQILHLYHSSQIGGAGETNSQLWHVTSKDRGATWSKPQLFYSLPGSFDRNRIIPTFNHTGFILPCYNSSPATDYSFILRLPAPASKLTRIDIKNSDDLIQPTIIRLNNTQQLRAFFRDENAGSIYYADSPDDGLTWTTPEPSTLPNNNAGIQANVLKSGAVIMAFNNHNDTKQPRTPMTVALSYDNGLTWPYHRDVQLHDDDSEHIGEYSYPSILQSTWTPSDGNDIHLVYTYDRLTIKYVRFNENWIKQGKKD